MNNNQFRRLVVDKPGSQNDGSEAAKTSSTPSTLGAKRSSFMPMTPRTVKGGIDVDFARQVRERNAALQPTKKFKTVAPKGVKYGAGYTDRAKERAEAGDGDGGDSKAARVTALEEQMKLGQISEATFVALRDEITGGDISSTHLVKGLDKRLLDRVRRGEDVLGTGANNSSADPPPDVDQELDKLGDQEVDAIKKEKAEKKGNMAPPPVAGVKRSRNEIMAELKAQRKAAAEARAAPALDSSKWKKVGEKERSRIQIDSKGREVLITVDEDGTVKKKIRRVPAHVQDGEEATIGMPDVSKPVLGGDANVPTTQLQHMNEEDEDDDIFEGVGAEYNPLGDDDDEDENSSESESQESGVKDQAKPIRPPSEPAEEAANDSKPAGSLEERNDSTTRNYFHDAPSAIEESNQDRLAGVQGLLKKAAKMDSQNSDESHDGHDVNEDTQARLKKRADMLASQDRDFDDMDMGFGSSRYDDGEEEGDGKKVKLSEWKGSVGVEKDGRDAVEKDGGKKKRKPKKRKGDANSMTDIMRVIEGRKGGSGK